MWPRSAWPESTSTRRIPVRPNSARIPSTCVSSSAIESETVPGNRRAPGAEPYGRVGATSAVDPVRKLERRRLGLHLIGPEREVRPVRLERPDREDHEGVRRQPTLERPGIEVDRGVATWTRCNRPADRI